MAHFYFHTWQGERRLADEVGMELPSQAKAHEFAARDLGEMARDALHGAPKAATFGIDVADAEGVILARLSLSFGLEDYG
jgi:hypothetical protein